MCVITIAVYGELSDATLDWHDLEYASSLGTIKLVDAVLVESDDDTVRLVHRLAPASTAHGALSSAVLAQLRPTALIVGAVAGGIGESTMMCVSRGIDRDAVHRLGTVFDQGPFGIAAITEHDNTTGDRSRSGPGSMAQAVATATTTITTDDVFWALFTDSEDQT